MTHVATATEDSMTERPLNLAPQRGPSVWDKPGARGGWTIEESEKWCVAVCGGTLAAIGLRQRTAGSLLLATAGGILAVRALLGHRDLVTLRHLVDRARQKASPGDDVATASEESFPASDPPSWASSAGAKTS